MKRPSRIEGEIATALLINVHDDRSMVTFNQPLKFSLLNDGIDHTYTGRYGFNRNGECGDIADPADDQLWDFRFTFTVSVEGATNKYTFGQTWLNPEAHPQYPVVQPTYTIQPV